MLSGAVKKFTAHSLYKVRPKEVPPRCAYLAAHFYYSVFSIAMTLSYFIAYCLKVVIRQKTPR